MSNKQQFEFTIEANKAERHYWADLWRYRELFYILAWRDISVRYKQTVIGVLWAVLRPLLTYEGIRRQLTWPDAKSSWQTP